MLIVVINLALLSCPAAETEPLPRMYPTFSFEGSWEEIGKQTALRFRDTVILTGFVFENFIGINADTALSYYEEIEDIIPATIKEQMRGMALGLSEYWNISYANAWERTLIVNFGIDILNKNKYDPPDDGCTAFAFHSADGTFLCHNTDNSKSNLEMGSLIHYMPDNGDNAFISFFAPAFVGVSLAINDKGLALTYNVGGQNKNPAPGLPVLFKTREVMATSDNLTQAVDMFTDFLDEGHLYGYGTANFLLVDFNNATMARLQVCSDDIKVTYGRPLEGKEGVTCLAFTNDFDEDFSTRDPDNINESSLERYERLLEILPGFEKYDIRTCWEMLSDTAGGDPTDNTICRRGEKTITTLTNIFTASTAYYTVGPPCEYFTMYDEPMSLVLDHGVKPSISGTVTALGRPLDRARVILKSDSNQGVEQTTYTDSTGLYAFNNLVEGTYRLQVNKFFHLPAMMSVDYQTGEEKQVDIKLLF